MIMKKIGAIITGDIIDSTALTVIEREIMLKALQEISDVLQPIVSQLVVEIFRGDSFQIYVHETKQAVEAAIGIRAWLRSQKLENSNAVLDARLAVGIGSIDFESNSLATSDGEAFRRSGRLLDEMTRSRLEISTPWESVNDELNVSTAFADDIISSWTESQSTIMLQTLLTRGSHMEVAGKLNISRQMVTKSLKIAKEELISNYIRRFETLISDHIKKKR